MQDDQPVVSEDTVNEEASTVDVTAPVEQESPEETTEVVETAEEEQPEADEAVEEAPEQPQPSRREQLRVQQLLKKYGPPPDAPTQSNGLDFRNKVAADEETYKTLEDTAQQYGQSMLAQAEVKQWRRFLKYEDTQVRSKFPQLDPSNQEQFHDVLANTMSQRYLNFVGYDPGDPSKGIPESVQRPDISYVDFVEADMEYADELASLKVKTTTQNIAKQAATTGLRPDGSSAKSLNLNKDPSQMTNEELEASIKAAPRDALGRFTNR